MTHNGSRVFASATPHSLEIWAEAEMGTMSQSLSMQLLYDFNPLHSDASDLVTFQYLREHRQERHPPTANALSQRSSPSGTTEDGESESDAQSMADDDDDDDVFKLVVRSAVTKDVILKVRPTTSCGAIVKAFLKRAGIADQYSESRSFRGPQLMVDGEHMKPDTPISEADLEDGDQVEVDGLR